MKPEQLYDLHCETVGGGKYGHVHWDDLPLESRIQWQRFATKVSEANWIEAGMLPGAPAKREAETKEQRAARWLDEIAAEDETADRSAA
tara:strand:- start:931 stop:1197 length:267 start_codon:yes stop_codon:yes gene_type:complete